MRYLGLFVSLGPKFATHFGDHSPHHVDYAAEPSYLHINRSALVQHILSRNGTHIGMPLPSSCQEKSFAGLPGGSMEPRFPSFETAESLRRSYFCFLIEPGPFLNPLVSGYCQLDSTLTSEAQSVVLETTGPFLLWTHGSGCMRT